MKLTQKQLEELYQMQKTLICRKARETNYNFVRKTSRIENDIKNCKK